VIKIQPSSAVAGVRLSARIVLTSHVSKREQDISFGYCCVQKVCFAAAGGTRAFRNGVVGERPFRGSKTLALTTRSQDRVGE